MRFVVAIVAFVLAAAAIGLGVAQRTVLAGPPSISSTVTTGDAALTIVDAETLNANAGTQGIEVAAEGDILLAYGRTADVLAWVGEADYNRIAWDVEAEELSTDVVSGSEAVSEIPSPVGSDLWLREFTGTGELTRKLNAPAGISILIAVAAPAPVEGEPALVDDPATEIDESVRPVLSTEPVDLSITWPLDNSAPASGPLVIGGIALLLGGLGAFLWALVHARSRRGPRRNVPKPPRLPKRPKPPQLKPQKGTRDGDATPELEAARPRGGRRRAFVAAGVLTAGVLALSGCSVAPGQPAPEPSATPPIPAIPTAVTSGQLRNILADAVATVADADAAADAGLAAQRLTGAALALRTANYTIRAADSAVAALAPIPDEDIEITLPQQTETWPRTVFAVSKAEGVPPVGLWFSQEAPRENYKISYAVTLVASVPDVAPPELGASPLAPSNNLGLIAPEALAAAYGDVLLHGDASESAGLFEAEGDLLREQIGVDYKAQRRAELPASATLEYSNGPGTHPVYSFVTNDNGQLVAVSLDDVETVRPVEAGAAVNPSGQVKALSGKSQSTRGIIATYGVQLLFYVPSISAADQEIVLLGYAHGLVAASEVP